jgi:hypothetical protein
MRDSRVELYDTSVGLIYFQAYLKTVLVTWDNPGSYPLCTRGSFFRKESGQGVKLTTHVYLLSRSRMVELYPHSPIRLHGVLLKHREFIIYLTVSSSEHIASRDSD